MTTDRATLSTFVDEQVVGGALDGITSVEADVVLVERRRYWTDREPSNKSGRFAPPPLLWLWLTSGGNAQQP